MEKEDIQYPAEEEVADDEVYNKFLNLQIRGEPIDLVSDDEDKGDDDHHHHDPKGSGMDEARIPGTPPSLHHPHHHPKMTEIRVRALLKVPVNQPPPPLHLLRKWKQP